MNNLTDDHHTNFKKGFSGEIILNTECFFISCTNHSYIISNGGFFTEGMLYNEINAFLKNVWSFSTKKIHDLSFKENSWLHEKSKSDESICVVFNPILDPLKWKYL